MPFDMTHRPFEALHYISTVKGENCWKNLLTGRNFPLEKTAPIGYPDRGGGFPYFAVYSRVMMAISAASPRRGPMRTTRV